MSIFSNLNIGKLFGSDKVEKPQVEPDIRPEIYKLVKTEGWAIRPFYKMENNKIGVQIFHPFRILHFDGGDILDLSNDESDFIREFHDEMKVSTLEKLNKRGLNRLRGIV